MFLLTTLDVAWAEPLVDISNFAEGTAIGKNLAVYVDERGSQQFEDIKALAADQFTPQDNAIPRFGFSQSTHWARVQFVNTKETPRVIYIENRYAQTDTIGVYSEAYPQGRTFGDKVPFENREVEHRYVVFRLKIPPGQSTVYFKIKTSGSVMFPLYFWRSASLRNHIIFEYSYLFLMLGFLVVMGLYNLFVAFTLKSKAYLFYVCYVASFCLAQFSQQGIGQQIFGRSMASSWVSNEGLIFGVELSGIFASIFAAHFLNLKTASPRSYLVLKALMVIFSLKSSVRYGDIKGSSSSIVTGTSVVGVPVPVKTHPLVL